MCLSALVSDYCNMYSLIQIAKLHMWTLSEHVNIPSRGSDWTTPMLWYQQRPIYIGSTIFKRSVLPCKIGPHSPVPCSVPFCGWEIVHMRCYNLLPFNPNTMDFVLTSQGHFPAGRKLVKGGHDQDGTPLYHGVAMLNGIRIPGTIRSQHWYVLRSVGAVAGWFLLL